MSDSEQPAQVRRRVLYRGSVQGVGFRYSTVEISHRFKVVGFVRNLPDGTVELETQGAAASVQAFLAAVAEYFKDNIVRMETHQLPPSADAETGFGIVH